MLQDLPRYVTLQDLPHTGLQRVSRLNNEKQKLRYHEKKKQKNTNIEDIANDDVTRDLDQNVDDMNVQNQTQEEIERVMYTNCKFV